MDEGLEHRVWSIKSEIGRMEAEVRGEAVQQKGKEESYGSGRVYLDSSSSPTPSFTFLDQINNDLPNATMIRPNRRFGDCRLGRVYDRRWNGRPPCAPDSNDSRSE